MTQPYFPIMLHDFQNIAFPSGDVHMVSGNWETVDSASEALTRIKRPRLLVDMKATNSGVPINNRVYPGPQVALSIESWTKDYPKPITDDHPSHSLLGGRSKPKVLGRVGKATYTRIVDETQWLEDWRKPLPVGSDGSGFVNLRGSVTDQSAIEQILDGRLLTVSVGAHPRKFFCSICTQDWIAKGPCEHKPGQTYTIDSKKAKGTYKAYGITGILDYNHIAFVDMPADVQARVLSSELADSREYFQVMTDTVLPTCTLNRLALIDDVTGQVVEFDLTPPAQSTSVVPQETAIIEAVADLPFEIGVPKEYAMSKETAQETPKPPEVEDAEGQTEDKPQVVDVNGNWTMPDPEDGHTHGLASLNTDGSGRTTASKGTKIPKHDHEIINGVVKVSSAGEGKEAYVSRHPGTFYFDSEGKIGIDPLNPTVEEIDEDCPNCFMNADLMEDEPMSEAEMKDQEEMVATFEQGHTADAVLTTAARKKLKGGTFCGPDRSFPVPDAAHARNALARLGQGFPKGATTATKARIRACVNRKAKTFGVKSKSADAGTQEAPVQDTENPTPKTPEVTPTPEPQENKTETTVIETMASELERKKSQVIRLENALSDAKGELEEVRKELDQLQAEGRKQVVDRVMDLRLTLDKPDVREAQSEEELGKIRTELEGRTIESLRDSAHDLQLELAERRNGTTISPSTPPVANPSLTGGPSGGSKVPSKAKALDKLRSD